MNLKDSDRDRSYKSRASIDMSRNEGKECNEAEGRDSERSF